MPERTLTCPDCGIKFVSRRTDGARVHCYKCEPPSAAEVATRGTPCVRCGRPCRRDKCARCRLLVACAACGGNASISGTDYAAGKRSAVCRKCRGTAPRRDREIRDLVCRRCGVEFKTKDQRPGRKFCSMKCSAAAQPTNRRTASCEVCGAEFTRKVSDFVRRDGNTGGRFCSKSCQGVATSAAAALHRLLHPGASRVRTYPFSRKVLLRHLADRDGVRCGICRRRIDIEARSGPENRHGPSVDHIVPVSLGGSDDLENLRLTCWICNVARGNRGGGEQLALVG